MKRSLFQGHLSPQTMEKESSELSQGRLKICKDDEKKINTIRPKVYITDSSSFKRLVQELTGNGRYAMSLPPIDELDDHVPVISIEGNGVAEVGSLRGESYGEMQMSVDLEDFGIPTWSPFAGFTGLQTSWMTQHVEEFQYAEVDTQQVEEFQYAEVDAWPVESYPFSFYDGYSFQTEEEMLCSPYDLSEL